MLIHIRKHTPSSEKYPKTFAGNPVGSNASLTLRCQTQTILGKPTPLEYYMEF